MAQFRTGRFQATLPIDVAVKGSVVEGTEVTSANRKAAICRNDFVKLVPASGSVPAYIEKATVDAATHIVALTDQTIGSHERKAIGTQDVSELVGATGSTVTASTPTKKVGLYPIFDKTDIIADADGNDHV
jgi:hypothetical protein